MMTDGCERHDVCWILNEAAASLRSIDGTTREQASFRCIVCNSEFGLRS